MAVYIYISSAQAVLSEIDNKNINSQVKDFMLYNLLHSRPSVNLKIQLLQRIGPSFRGCPPAPAIGPVLLNGINKFGGTYNLTI